jgi:2-keto-4-pentenoate hydratase/2-oxohepta-3-ene-1,7-dioic acid hydratase in catechol pathway
VRLARVRTTEESAYGGDVVAAVGHGQGWVPMRALGLAEDTVSSHAHAALADTLRAADLRSLDGVTIEVPDASLAHPLTNPGKIICIGLNYRDHIAEIGATAPAVPLVFAKYANALNDPFADVHVPGDETAQLDFEAELALVIGRRGTWISEADARSYVSAYTVADDVSSRDIQFAEGQWTRSKSFDGFCPVGPWLTTSDEVEDPQALAIGTDVNGVKRQQSSTAELLFGIDEIVSFVSRGITLEPGDLILTGTPPGVAMGSTEPVWLQPGDVVRCWVEGLGEVRNTIAAGPR